MNTSLANRRVLITGVGIKPVEYVFKDISTGKPSHTPISVGGKEYKTNIGAAAALECARAGAVVHLVARTESKLLSVAEWIKENIPSAQVEYSVLDLNDLGAMQKNGWVYSRRHPSILGPISWSGGGTVRLRDDNPYLLIDNITEELIEAELTVLKNTIALLQILLPRFRKQKETRICVVSSMSAIRSIISGSMHMAAKGAISRFTNAAMIELDKENIFITDVRPGGVDTGMYDSPAVQNTITEISRRYGYDWSKENGGARLMPPSSVGEMVVSVLSSEAHITSVNMVARGQFPHEGS